jgi:fructosamine-3-kinase
VSSGLAEAVRGLLGVDVVSARPVGGGCISDARRVELADGRVVFVKSGAGLPDDLLSVEAAGLRWLADGDSHGVDDSDGVRVPAVVALGESRGSGDDHGQVGPPVLVLEWIERGVATSSTAERLGRGLATLHARGAPGFGWVRDGFIGSLPQRNTPMADDWPSFWFGYRIEPLAQQATDRRSLSADAGALVRRLGDRLPDLAAPAEPPARLHGDLWSGNVMVGAGGEPWVVDPAPYGGHREVDLAMLHLFGRPAPATIDAYQEVTPLAPGWRERLSLWQLEPLLVHAVLFGPGYGDQAHQVLRRFT